MDNEVRLVTPGDLYDIGWQLKLEEFGYKIRADAPQGVYVAPDFEDLPDKMTDTRVMLCTTIRRSKALRLLGDDIRAVINAEPSDQEIRAGLEALSSGTTYVSNKFARKYIHNVENALTKRQYEVAIMLARGIEAKEIATALNISVGTVQLHQGNVYERLGIHSRKELMTSMNSSSGHQDYASHPLLTKRQREVASLAKEGMSNVEIAQRLGISNGVVGLHLHSIYQKLNISRRYQL